MIIIVCIILYYTFSIQVLSQLEILLSPILNSKPGLNSSRFHCKTKRSDHNLHSELTGWFQNNEHFSLTYLFIAPVKNKSKRLQQNKSFQQSQRDCSIFFFNSLLIETSHVLKQTYIK